MALQIPEEHKQHLFEFAQLPPESIDRIVKAIAAEKPKAPSAEFSRKVANATDLNRKLIENVLSVFVAFYATSYQFDMALEDVVEDVLTTIFSEDFEGISKVTNKPTLKDRVMRVMTSGTALQITAKIAAVARVFENVFTRAKIVSDIRTIFTGSGPEPSAAMIVHNLEIICDSDEGTSKHFFGMDSQDLRALRVAIDRALAKEESLKKMVENSKLAYIDFAGG